MKFTKVLKITLISLVLLIIIIIFYAILRYLNLFIIYNKYSNFDSNNTHISYLSNIINLDITNKYNVLNWEYNSYGILSVTLGNRMMKAFDFKKISNHIPKDLFYVTIEETTNKMNLEWLASYKVNNLYPNYDNYIFRTSIPVDYKLEIMGAAVRGKIIKDSLYETDKYKLRLIHTLQKSFGLLKKKNDFSSVVMMIEYTLAKKLIPTDFAFVEMNDSPGNIYIISIFDNSIGNNHLTIKEILKDYFSIIVEI